MADIRALASQPRLYDLGLMPGPSQLVTIDSMREMRLLTLLGRVPPGVWTGVIWCSYTIYSVRMFLGIPGMPYVPGQRFSLAGWLVLAAATTAAVAGSVLLSRWPLPGLGLLLLGSAAAALAVGSPTIHLAHYFAADIALGVIVASRPWPAWVAALAVTLAALPGYALLRVCFGHAPELLDGWYLYALTAAVGWLAGNSARLARTFAEELRGRAAVEAVAVERLRISRELHDMLAHSMGIIALQAGAAARVIDTQPEQARGALREVESASRETLAGLRRMIVAFRPEDGGPGTGSPREPAPGLADVEGLAASATAAGVRVDVKWQGERRPLPADIELAAYRVIQESVTNVIRHAGTSSCEVLVEQHEETLSIEITNTGPGGRRGHPAGSTGHGLTGMRERVALLQGDFTAGPRPDGGFRVAARLPVPAKAQPA